MAQTISLGETHCTCKKCCNCKNIHLPKHMQMKYLENIHQLDETCIALNKCRTLQEAQNKTEM